MDRGKARIAADQRVRAGDVLPMFRQKPSGRRHIKVCRTLCCALVGGTAVGEEFRRQFAGDAGGASFDGEVTVEIR